MDRVSYPGLLQPLSIFQRTWRNITMSLIKGLPKSGGRNAILVIVEKFTKYRHLLVIITHSFTT